MILKVQFYVEMADSETIFLLLAITAMVSSCALTMPVNATSNPVGNKVGSAKATGYLGILFFNADASIQTAAKNGGITEISTVDVKTTNILNIILTYETIVTGK
jgi:hypothetical protein